MSSIDSLPSNPLKLSSDAGITTSKPSPKTEGHLLVGANGTIQYADLESGAILGHDPAALPGKHLLDLLDFAIETSDPDGIKVQWDLLLTSALEARVPVPATRGNDGRSVTVYLRFSDAGVALFASLRTEGYEPTFSADPEPAGLEEEPGQDLNWAPLFDRSDIGLFDLNFGSGQITYSPGWKQMLGFEDNELPNNQSTWIDLIHPDDSDAAPHQSIRRKPDESRSFNLEFRMRTRSGEYRWLHSQGIQLFDQDGKLSRVIGIHLDIQERKEIEEETIQNEDRFFAFLNHTDRGFFDLDFPNETAFFSAPWRKQLGYSEQDLELTPKGFLELLPPGDAAAGLDAFFADPELNRPIMSRRYRLKHKDGHWENFEAHIIRITNRSKDLVRVIGMQIPPGAQGDERAELSISQIFAFMASLSKESPHAKSVAVCCGDSLLFNPQCIRRWDNTRDWGRSHQQQYRSRWGR